MQRVVVFVLDPPDADITAAKPFFDKVCLAAISSDRDMETLHFNGMFGNPPGEQDIEMGGVLTVSWRTGQLVGEFRPL